MKYTLLSFFVMIGAMIANAQVARFKAEEQINAIKADNLGAFYVVHHDSKLTKYNSQGEVLGNFSIQRYGAISKLELTNPFQIGLFFEDVKHLILLDTRLQLVKDIDLSGYGDVKAQSIVAAADRSGFFFWDNAGKQLKKATTFGEVATISANLPAIDIERAFVDGDKMIFCGDNQFFVLDNTLQHLQSTFALEDIVPFEVKNQILLGKLKDKMFKINTETGEKMLYTPKNTIDEAQTYFITNHKLIKVSGDKMVLVFDEGN